MLLSFLAPGYLIAAVAAAAGLVAGHFIVRRQPRALLLPTARFVPDAPVVTVGWTRAPADLLTLALRVLTVILAGVALAGPVIRNKPGGVGRVILVDRSRAVADTSEVQDSLAALMRPGDAVVGYASTSFTAAVPAGVPPEARNERGSLSVGLVAAVRAASALREQVDSVELVIISTFAAEQLDAAAASIRREWPGRARLVQVAAAPRREDSRSPELVAAAEDGFRAALSAARSLTPAEVRIARGDIGAADSAWLAGAAGRVLLHWPAASAPAGFIARPRSSMTHALVGAHSVVVAPFERRWQHVRAVGSKPVAWWMDGDVAAAELRQGDGCLRSVAVPVSPVGDFVLRADFHAILGDLLQPCGGAAAYATMPAGLLAMLRGPGSLAPSTAFAPPDRDASTMTKWLLFAALACAVLELFVRRTASAQAGSSAQRAARGATTRKAA